MFEAIFYEKKFTLKQISLVNLEFKNITDRASFEQIHTIKFIYFGA